MVFKNISLCLVLAAVGATVLPLAAAPPTATLPGREPDWAALIGPYPPAGSPRADADLAIMLWLQRTRTTADVARATAEIRIGLGWFQDVLGKDFDPAAHPLTLKLLNKARHDADAVVGALKSRYQRPRPYLTAHELVPALHREPTYSYPSGHSTLAVVYSRILAELDPAHRDAILERGLLIGNDRSLGGVHWPSDVEAGHKLGEAYAAYWLEIPEHSQLAKAAHAAEWK